ncbi:hypothetical protein DL93DRAFT_2086898 [Clavulina sp. PMI_390]|nr:hypothetical protein DL93DRAFT_2086898 [Clavulina sp. PMI_390]
MTHTGDNAGNVGTLTRSLVDRLHADGQWHLDADTSQIRCLSHIIHLAIMALLENMGVLKQGDPRQSAEEVEVVDFLTEVEAEALSAEIEVNQSEDEIEAEAVEDASLLESANICKRVCVQVRSIVLMCCERRLTTSVSPASSYCQTCQV